MQTHTHQPATSTTIELDRLACVCCAAEIERALKQTPHVIDAHVDYAHDTIHVTFHPGMLTRQELEDIIEQTGTSCKPQTAESGISEQEHVHDAEMHAAPATGQTQPSNHVHLPEATGGPATHDHAMPGAEHEHRMAPSEMKQIEHRAQLAPITMGTKMDRMQYELPATGAHATHTMATPHAGHGAEAEAHAAHAGMHHDMADPKMARAMEADMRNRFWIALVLTLLILLYSPLGSGFLNIRMPAPVPVNWILLVLTTPVVFYCGWIFISGAYYSLRARMLNMSVLIATGVLAAYLFSVFITLFTGGETFYDAAAMLVTFVLFGHWMEMRARRGTTDALRALFDLVPPTARVLRDGQAVEVPTSEIVVGDMVQLRPGDKVPVDGVIVSGQTGIDESLVTGESMPVSKHPGDQVVAGSINTTGAVTFRSTKVGAETTLGQIVKLVEQAQASKAPGQRLADRAAQYLVILAVGSGIVTFLAWYFLGHAAAITALTFAISAVVVACPDALGLATPTAVAVGTGIGAKYNILIKDAATLEGIARITSIVLDKTGTLTEGKPRLTDIVLATPHAGLDEIEMLRLVGAAEQHSEHPLAHALVEGAKERGIALVEPGSFEALNGRGVAATIEGQTVLVGNRTLMTERGIAIDPLSEQASALAQEGKTPMYVAVNGVLAGLVAVADTIKPSARQTVHDLQARGIEVVMLTGDNRRTAEAVARQLGITRVFAEVLPQDKARYVQQLQSEGKIVAMVGDGVNDAPALAQADTGIAIGAGTDVAIETARVVLMKSNPLDIIRALQISQATVTKMKQNLVWASIYNILAIPVAAGVLYPEFGIMLRPEWSALLMSLSSIIVATNAVLLKQVEGQLVPEQPATGSRPLQAAAS